MIKSAQKFNLPGDVDRWKHVRGEICDEVRGMASTRSRQLRAELWGQGTRCKPAANTCLGFLPPHDPRIRSTVSGDIERRLMADGFVCVRHRAHGRWLHPAKARSWRAVRLAELTCCLAAWMTRANVRAPAGSVATTSGVLSEEYDVGNGPQVGNFPQAFSH